MPFCCRVAYLVAFVDKLVRTGYQFKSIDVVKLGGHLVTKQPTGPARTDCPGVYLFRIGPHQVAKGTFMGNFLGTSHDPDLVDCPDLGAQTAMHTENLAIHYGSKNEEIKNMTASLPN